MISLTIQPKASINRNQNSTEKIYGIIDFMETNQMGVNLEKLLQKKDIKISQLARDIGVSPKTLSEWIGSSGRFPSNPFHIKRLSLYFNVSVHELMFGEVDPLATPNNVGMDSKSFTAIIHSGLYQITVEKIDVDYSTGKKLEATRKETFTLPIRGS
jgi:transcriptional regulator with XRE-family HTH domain